MVILEPGLAALGRAVLGQVAVPDQPPEDLPLEIGRGDRFGLEHVGCLAALRGQADLQLLLGLGQLLVAGGIARRGGRRPATSRRLTISSSTWAWAIGSRSPPGFLSRKITSIIRWASATSIGSSPTVAATAGSAAGSGWAKAGAAIQRKANRQTKAENRLFMGPVLCDAEVAGRKSSSPHDSLARSGVTIV